MIQPGSVPTQYAVGWFTLALINAGVAQGKGRSGLAWWVLSLFLGPLATFLLVVLDPVKPPLPPGFSEAPGGRAVGV